MSTSNHQENTILDASQKDLPAADPVLVSAAELRELIAQNADLKQDVIALVEVFASFEGLFTGKSVMSAVPVIMKLLNDKNRLAQIENIVPILHKYTVNNG